MTKKKVTPKKKIKLPRSIRLDDDTWENLFIIGANAVPQLSRAQVIESIASSRVKG